MSTEIDRDALLQVFSAEAEEQLRSIEQGLVALERAPDEKRNLPELFRRAHTLKGNASVVGFEALVQSAHVMEDALERLLDGRLQVTRELVTLLLDAVDALREMVAAALAGEEDLQPARLQLAAWLARTDAARAAGAAPPESTPTLAERAVGAKVRRTLRVDVEKLDRILDLLGELSVARGRTASLLEGGQGAALAEIRDSHRDADPLFMELQQQIMSSRMVPVGPLFRQLARTVRDLALRHGKEARLVVEGDEVEIDTTAIEGIRDPLVHMIRNAIDHGLESPAARVASGKDAVGTISLKARYDGGRVLVELSDDGAGLNWERIRARARAQLPLLAVDSMGDDDLAALIFQPGFSTAAEVTDLSGRGVGMDVVKRAVEGLRGTVDVESRAGEGTRVTLGLPLTLAIIEGFQVGVGAQTYVFPLESVVECVELPPAQRRERRARDVLNLRGRPLPFLRLSHHFGLQSPDGSRESVVVVEGKGRRAGFAVDALHGEGQTVIKPMPRGFQRAQGVSGAALLGNGRVALVLDVGVLLAEANQGAVEPGQAEAAPVEAPRPPVPPEASASPGG